jgi:hypothetical protein
MMRDDLKTMPFFLYTICVIQSVVVGAASRVLTHSPSIPKWNQTPGYLGVDS